MKPGKPELSNDNPGWPNSTCIDISNISQLILLPTLGIRIVAVSPPFILFKIFNVLNGTSSLRNFGNDVSGINSTLQGAPPFSKVKRSPCWSLVPEVEFAHWKSDSNSKHLYRNSFQENMTTSSWWLKPTQSKKICLSNWIMSPGRAEN